MIEALKLGNLALRFLLEVAVLIALGAWGFHAGKTLPLKLLLCAGAPLLVAVTWAMLGSPAAPYPLPGVWHAVLELAVFGAGVGALWASGQRYQAGALALAVGLNRVLMLVWRQ